MARPGGQGGLPGSFSVPPLPGDTSEAAHLLTQRRNRHTREQREGASILQRIQGAGRSTASCPPRGTARLHAGRGRHAAGRGSGYTLDQIVAENNIVRQDASRITTRSRRGFQLPPGTAGLPTTAQQVAAAVQNAAVQNAAAQNVAAQNPAAQNAAAQDAAVHNAAQPAAATNGAPVSDNQAWKESFLQLVLQSVAADVQVPEERLGACSGMCRLTLTRQPAMATEGMAWDNFPALVDLVKARWQQYTGLAASVPGPVTQAPQGALSTPLQSVGGVIQLAQPVSAMQSFASAATGVAGPRAYTPAPAVASWVTQHLPTAPTSITAGAGPSGLQQHVAQSSVLASGPRDRLAGLNSRVKCAQYLAEVLEDDCDPTTVDAAYEQLVASLPAVTPEIKPDADSVTVVVFCDRNVSVPLYFYHKDRRLSSAAPLLFQVKDRHNQLQSYLAGCPAAVTLWAQRGGFGPQHEPPNLLDDVACGQVLNEWRDRLVATKPAARMVEGERMQFPATMEKQHQQLSSIADGMYGPGAPYHVRSFQPTRVIVNKSIKLLPPTQKGEKKTPLVATRAGMFKKMSSSAYYIITLGDETTWLKQQMALYSLLMCGGRDGTFQMQRGPAAQGPVQQGSAAQGPVHQGPAAQGPAAQGPAAHGPAAHGPAADSARTGGAPAADPRFGTVCAVDANSNVSVPTALSGAATHSIEASSPDRRGQSRTMLGVRTRAQRSPSFLEDLREAARSRTNTVDGVSFTNEQMLVLLQRVAPQPPAAAGANHTGMRRHAAFGVIDLSSPGRSNVAQLNTQAFVAQPGAADANAPRGVLMGHQGLYTEPMAALPADTGAVQDQDSAAPPADVDASVLPTATVPAATTGTAAFVQDHNTNPIAQGPAGDPLGVGQTEELDLDVYSKFDAAAKSIVEVVNLPDGKCTLALGRIDGSYEEVAAKLYNHLLHSIATVTKAGDLKQPYLSNLVLKFHGEDGIGRGPHLQALRLAANHGLAVKSSSAMNSGTCMFKKEVGADRLPKWRLGEMDSHAAMLNAMLWLRQQAGDHIRVRGPAPPDLLVTMLNWTGVCAGVSLRGEPAEEFSLPSNFPWRLTDAQYILSANHYRDFKRLFALRVPGQISAEWQKPELEWLRDLAGTSLTVQQLLERREDILKDLLRTACEHSVGYEALRLLRLAMRECVSPDFLHREMVDMRSGRNAVSFVERDWTVEMFNLDYIHRPDITTAQQGPLPGPPPVDAQQAALYLLEGLQQVTAADSNMPTWFADYAMNDAVPPPIGRCADPLLILVNDVDDEAPWDVSTCYNTMIFRRHLFMKQPDDKDEECIGDYRKPETVIQHIVQYLQLFKELKQGFTVA